MKQIVTVKYNAETFEISKHGLSVQRHIKYFPDTIYELGRLRFKLETREVDGEFTTDTYTKGK